MLSKKYNKKNKSKKSKFKKTIKNSKKTNKFKKNKLKKTNKNKSKRNKKTIKNKSKRSKKIIKQIGGVNTNNYLISSLHGFILRDTSDINDLSKNPMITIPKNINLVTYADFCSKACNRTIDMQQYICNSDNFVGAIDGPNKIYGQDSIIPEIYLADEPNQSTIIKSCNDESALGLYKLSNLLKETFKTPLVNPTNIHLLVCLDVFDISNMENKDNIENEFNHNLLLKLSHNNFMIDCNEDALKIKPKNPLPTNINLKPNTIIAYMSGAKEKLELKFQNNIKSNDKYGTYPAIIEQFNVLFKNHAVKQPNKKFIYWLYQRFYDLTLNEPIDDSESSTIGELILKISNGYDINPNDNNLYTKIVQEIPELEVDVTKNSDTITIDMSTIDISDRNNAVIIKKYLLKILNYKINKEGNHSLVTKLMDFYKRL